MMYSPESLDCLEHKVILVTGASSGIGRATCRELARRGAYVALLARREDAMRETMSAFPDGAYLTIKADLQNVTALPGIVESVWNWKGHVDGFIHCAGIGGKIRFRDVTVEIMQRFMQVHCYAFVEIARTLTRLKKNANLLQVVSISSLAAMGHDKYLLAYGASKAALETAAKSMAVELARKNTLVNLIRSAFVNTPMNTGAESTMGSFADLLAASGYQPLGVIQPEEVARMAAYLVSPAAVHISGAIFTINGGEPC